MLAGTLAASVLLLAPTSRAEGPGPLPAPLPTALPTDPLLARLIDESLRARPELASAESLVRAERERIPQAGALPDPMFQIGIQNDGFTSIEIGRQGTSFVSFMAQQTFPWPGKRDLRAELVAIGAVVAKAQATRARLSAEADVRRAYIDLLLAREHLELHGRLDGLLGHSAEVARILYETGKAPQSDVLRAELELLRNKQRHLAYMGIVRAREQSLNRLRNRPLDEPIAVNTKLSDLPAPSSLEGQFSTARALGKSPELEAARLEIARTGKAVSLAGKGYYPDLTVGAGLMVRGQLPPMWAVTLGAPVPVFSGDKQSRAVVEGRAREEAARKTAAAFEQVVRLRSAERHTTFVALLRILDVYARGLLTQSEATAESTLTQYKVGRVPLAAVLEASTGSVADTRAYLEALAAAHRILISEAEVSLSETTAPGDVRGTTAAASTGGM
ncbi:MAG TPA: TolC family protein [Polyangiaceae bacterium]|nr:TolC family protein [Polyangiaceae bacterium]